MEATTICDQLKKDVRFVEGLKACMNCGVCTALCPAASFFDYDPRKLLNMVQDGTEEELTALLKSDYIWLCGQCMSCKPRCPRGNIPGLVIMALRQIAQERGLFVHSAKGRQQLQIVKSVGANILQHGYCIYPENVVPADHPEQGPVWQWIHSNLSEVMNLLGENYQQEGPGTFRTISTETLDEIHRIFEESGAIARFETIEKHIRNYHLLENEL